MIAGYFYIEQERERERENGMNNQRSGRWLIIFGAITFL
jgi:hypothetical protein